MSLLQRTLQQAPCHFSDCVVVVDGGVFEVIVVNDADLDGVPLGFCAAVIDVGELAAVGEGLGTDACYIVGDVNGCEPNAGHE